MSHTAGDLRTWLIGPRLVSYTCVVHRETSHQYMLQAAWPGQLQETCFCIALWLGCRVERAEQTVSDVVLDGDAF